MSAVRRFAANAAAALALALAFAPGAAWAQGDKILRVAFPVAETGFDPAQIVDLYSRTVTPHIFEAPYQYDHLARPYKYKPLTAKGMPEISADYRTWTVRLQPGIYFQDDPAFRLPPGERRELVAQDYVYSFKRIVDPANKSPVVAGLLDAKIIGLAALREAATDGRPFDYDTPIEGLRALDRYTLQFRFEEPRPRFMDTLASSDLFGAVAREVVEHYGDQIMAHPVGTGPFRLAQWRRSSLIVLERNPEYRDVRWQAEPSPGDAAGEAIAQRLRGQRLPLIDRVEISIIEEDQPRWLAFLNGQLDYLAVPSNYITQAVPGGVIAPHLERRGIVAHRTLNADSTFLYFNMEDPVVGGYTPEKVALRRAIGLGKNVEREIVLLRRGQAVPAQSIVVPHTSGFDPDFKSENGDYDPARARALLEIYGYRDRDGDGFRELPDGSPLVLEFATQPDQLSRQFDETMRKDMEAIGIRITFFAGKWPEQLKAARAGKLQLWSIGSSAAGTDGQTALQRLYGPQAGSANIARFQNDEFDRIYERMQQIPDGPERDELFRRAKLISVALMPYKINVHRIANDLTYGYLTGYRRPLFWNQWWHMVDLDADERARVHQ